MMYNICIAQHNTSPSFYPIPQSRTQYLDARCELHVGSCNFGSVQLCDLRLEKGHVWTFDEKMSGWKEGLLIERCWEGGRAVYLCY